jgi:hypothetical protein
MVPLAVPALSERLSERADCLPRSKVLTALGVIPAASGHWLPEQSDPSPAFGTSR